MPFNTVVVAVVVVVVEVEYPKTCCNRCRMDDDIDGRELLLVQFGRKELLRITNEEVVSALLLLLVCIGSGILILLRDRNIEEGDECTEALTFSSL